MIYLKKFETVNEYNTYINGSDKVLPNVSLTVGDNVVHYNPYVEEVNNVITYTGSGRAYGPSGAEISSEYFNTPIVSHTFENGVGVITFEDDVTEIKADTFVYCETIFSIIIPNSVTSIGESTFLDCTSLSSVTIGSGVTSIGTYAFWSCTKLSSITCNATTAPTIDSNTFFDVKSGGTLTVPIGSSGYDVWMGTGDYYLGKFNWTKVEQ